MKFKIGDRVRAIGKVDGINLKGKTGTIIEECRDSCYDCCVEFDEPIDRGHDGNGTGKSGHCRYAKSRELEPVKKKGKFEVGDKVIGNEKASKEYSITIEGWIGTIVGVTKDGKIDVNGKGLFGSECVFDSLNAECFDLYEEKPVKEEKEKGWRIEIVPDGEETTATLYKRGKAVKSATVKRYKGDEYSIADAADYAVKKLFEKKNKKEFKIGARVVGVGSFENKNIDGYKGTIREYVGGHRWGVEFDEDIRGHKLGVGDCPCKDGHGWYCEESHLKLL